MLQMHLRNLEISEVDGKDDGSGTYEQIRKDSFYWYQELIRNMSR